jgi:hypothetical protein
MMTRRGMAVVMAMAMGLVGGGLAMGQVAAVASGGTAARSVQQRPRSARNAWISILPELLVKDQPLGAVIDAMRASGGTTIQVDWKSLEGVGVTKDTKISLALTEVEFGEALGLVMDETHPTAKVLTYVDMNMIQITTQAVADTKLITRSYDVRDLTGINVGQVLPSRGNGIGANNYGSGTTNQAQTIGGGTGGTTFGTQQQGQQTGVGRTGTQQQNGGQTTGQVIQAAQTQAGTDLVNLVKTTIRPDIWSDGKGGGGPATITYFSGRLVVSAPIYVQEQIGGTVAGH